MGRIWAIATNTFRESLRKKALNTISIFALVLIVGSRAFMWLAPGEEVKIIKDMGLGGILFFGMLIAVFGSGGLIPQEIERRTIFTILAKPVRRTEFLLGKFLGSFVTVSLHFLIMSAAFLAMVWWKEKWIDIDILKSLALTWVELEVLVSIAIAVSTIASAMFNVSFTFFIWIIGHLTGNLKHMAEMAESVIVKTTLLVLYTILPNFENFNVRCAAVVGDDIPSSLVWLGIKYGLLFSLVMLVLSALFFAEREV